MGLPIHILLVDDDMYIIDRLIADIHWEALDAQPFRAISSREAKSILQENEIGIMVCDIEMPGENGIRLLEWVRAHHPQVECIFLTNHDNFQYAQRAIQLKCFDYVLKPVPGEALQEVLRHAVKQVEQKRLEEKLAHYGSWVDKHFSQAKKHGGATDNADDMVKNTMEYISEHIGGDLSVEALAKRLFISSDYLMRCFKKHAGTSVTDYVIEKRLSLASKMLIDTPFAANSIANTVGYHSYSHFSNAFKKYYGVGPVQYRKLYGKREKIPE